MAHDPLATLIRLRQAACDDAQRNVVSCLAAENRAEWDANDAERSIARETEAASDPSGTDGAVEAFAAWLPGARRRVEESRWTLENLQAETARARAGLTACRTALESVEALQEHKRQVAKSAEDRRWQLELDERSHKVCDLGRLGAAEDAA